MDSLSDFFINQVNPKFKEYNRPLFVAIAVFIPTVALTFLLFTIMLNDCNSMVVTADSLSSLQPLLEGAKCIHGSSRVTALCRQLNYQCEVSYTACKVDFIDYCNEGSANYNYYQTQADPCPTYAPFQANAEMCPDVLPTFGAALGYAGFIELALTVCIVFGLTQTGCITGGPKGHMGQMIKEIIEEKDTGKEIADVVGESA